MVQRTATGSEKKNLGMEEQSSKPASPAASKPSTSSKAPSTSASTRRATGESKKSQDSKSRLSTASRKTQTSLDVIERDVERIKAKIKTGEDIDAQEVLQAVLLMLDDMRLTMTELKDEKKKNTPDVEVIVHPNEAPNDVGEKHSLLNVNVKNLRKNLSALQMYTQIQACPSFMVVTETSIQELDQAQLKGYHPPVFKTRNATKLKGGGVGIYVRTQYGMQICDRMTSIEYKVKHVEFVGVEASLDDFWKILIVGIFRPSGKTPNDILKELELIFKTAVDAKMPCIIAGDFNVDVNNINDALAKKYIALINKYNLRMVVKEPTRISGKSNALFDHILVGENMTPEVVATVQDIQVADHQITLAEWF